MAPHGLRWSRSIPRCRCWKEDSSVSTLLREPPLPTHAKSPGSSANTSFGCPSLRSNVEPHSNDHAFTANGNASDGGRRVREVRVHEDPVEVGDDEKRRALKGLAVLEKLLVGRIEVLVLALVLPAEEALLPDIGRTMALSEARELRQAPAAACASRNPRSFHGC